LQTFTIIGKISAFTNSPLHFSTGKRFTFQPEIAIHLSKTPV